MLTYKDPKSPTGRQIASALYCDMDGVLVDFESGANDALQTHHGKDLKTTEANATTWKHLSTVPNFWHELDPTEDFLKLWKYIRKFNPHILSAYPPSMKNDAIHGKSFWLDKHLAEIPKSRIILCLKADKPNYAVSGADAPGVFQRPNILIDDDPKNIERWTAAGGIGILHTSAADTIRQLTALDIQPV